MQKHLIPFYLNINNILKVYCINIELLLFIDVRPMSLVMFMEFKTSK